MKFTIPRLRFSLSKKLLFWLMLICIVMVTMLIVVNFITGKQERIVQAINQGQHVEISLNTGEILSQSQDTAPPQTEDTPTNTDQNTQQEAEEDDTIASTDSGQDEESDQNDEQSEEEQQDPTYISVDKKFGDFIGPRLVKRKSSKQIKKAELSELSDRPIIILVVKGLGLSASTTEQAMELPKNVTLGFSPYSPYLEKWVKKATETGHNVLVNVPMETSDYRSNDPGPYSLVSSSSNEDNNTRLNMLLSLVDGYIGIYSEKDEIFTHNAGSAKNLMQKLKEKNVAFIHGGGHSNFSLIQIADEIDYPMFISDVILDNDITKEDINQKLQEAENIAKEKGITIAMARPYPITIRLLKYWLANIQDRGIEVLPLSALIGG